MKNAKLLITTTFPLLLGGVLFGQNSNSSEGEVQKIQGNYLGLSAQMRDLPQIHDESEIVYEHNEGDVYTNRKRPEAVNDNALPKGEDPVRQKYYEKSDNAINIDVNVPGMGGAFPPDPTGAASEDYYVQAVNTTYRVYNKDGTFASGSIALSDLWPGSGSDGDPIVMWDRHAERFVITQFQTGSNEILFAVSETADPLGAYYLYEFSFPSLPDYPKYSVWSNGYYMTSNSGSENVVAFERDKMLDGDPNASMISLNLPSFSTGSPPFRSVLPADADGDLPPFDTPISLFLFQDDSWNGVTEDHIEVLEMDVDWDTPGNSTIVSKQEIPTEPFNSVFSNNWNDIVQKGTSQKLDAIATIFNYRAQYIRWSGYNTLLLCNVVDVDNNNTAGIRWYELRQDDDDQDWEIEQQSTFSPDDGASRFLGSIAMDYNGNIAMGYSISGPDDYPGIGITGRFPWHASGDMALPETIAEEGGGFQTGTERYGDYSHMSLDPDGETFWYTGEYVGAGGKGTRIISFNLQKQLGADQEDEPIKDPSMSLNQDNELIIVEGINLPNNEEMSVELFAVNGQKLDSKKKTVADGEIITSFSKANLNSGIYLVRIGKENFQRVSKI
ncbi:MAG: T9SS type A sorting domain-containing protein, partial [Brumimicrobium sp.]